MLGSYHDSLDNGVTPDGTNSPDSANSPYLDPSNNIFYGGDGTDGFIGQVLTAEAINKTAFLISSLAYNGIELEMVAPATYDPANGILYFPHQIAVTEATVLDGLPPKAATLTVTNASSNQFDQLSYLWETVNSKNMITVATKPILPIMKFLTAPPSLLPCRNHNLLWNTGSLPNGIYFVRISTSGSGMISKKVVIL